MHCRESSRLPFTFKMLFVYLNKRRKEIRLIDRATPESKRIIIIKLFKKMSKISQKDLDKAVEEAKEDFNNNNSLFLEKVGDAFLKIFDHLSEGYDEQQAAFISGQLGYYRRKLIQTVDKTLKQFIDEVELTAEITNKTLKF